MDRPGRMRPWWRRRTAAAALGAAAVVCGLVGPAASSASASPAVAADRTPFVQQNCPGTLPVYPPSSSYYGVPLASTLSGGTLTIGSVTKTTGLSATICGLLKFPELTASIPGRTCTAATEAGGCITFGAATTTLDGLVSLPTTFTPGPTTVSVSKTAASNGGLNVSITAQVTTHVDVVPLGVSCSVGPITITLTTGASGPLDGAAVTGPLTMASAKIVGGNFAVPAAGASTDCPSGLLPATNGLVGLPSEPGVAQFSAPVTLANSLT